MKDFIKTIKNLDVFLKRVKKSSFYQVSLNFEEILKKTLGLMKKFVPSQAGSILLDNPVLKLKSPALNNLTFVAVFGKNSEKILGKKLSLKKGIASFVYKNERSYICNNPKEDPNFDPSWDEISFFETKSILAVPIKIERSIIGVIELINRKKANGFNEKDLEISEHLADYIGLSIQSFLDAKRVEDFAILDELSTLYNDRYLHLKLTELIKISREKNEDLMLLFIDLNNFKSVNDNYGHLVGSQVLREVGILLKNSIEYKNALFSRYGGDEFVLVLPGASLKEAKKVKEKILNALKSHAFVSEGYGFFLPKLNLKGIIGASIGISSLKKDIKKDLSIEEQKDLLLRIADSRMYKEKINSSCKS